MNEKEDDIFYIDEEYKILNDKIINLLEENYLKKFRKEVKKFQIVAVGYNASEQKDLRVFYKHGWNVYTMIGASNNMSICACKCQISQNMECWIRVVKNDETNTLASEKISKGYITIVVDNENDGVLYNLIKQRCERFGNDSLNFNIRRQLDGCKYYLDITCKI